MSVDRSLRSTLAAILLIAALFVAMNRVVASAPIADWWLPLALFVIGAALVPNWNFSRSQPDEAPPALPEAVRTYRISSEQVPRLQTMTIRPDPESSEYTVVKISEDTPGSVMPFMETEVAGASSTTATAPAPAPTATPEAPHATAPTPTPTASPEPPAAPTAAPEEVPQAIAPAPTPTAAAPSAEASGASPDDLIKLNGIGPKSAAALKAAGIDTFQKLADSSEDQIRAAVADVRLVGDVTTWAQQAKFAAQGDWAGLSDFIASQKKPATGD